MRSFLSPLFLAVLCLRLVLLLAKGRTYACYVSIPCVCVCVHMMGPIPREAKNIPKIRERSKIKGEAPHPVSSLAKFEP